MRNGLFNVGAEALEDYETGVPTTNEARADTLRITRSSPTLLTSSHTRSPTARVWALLKRLLAHLATIESEAAGRRARGDVNSRRVMVRAYAGRRARRWRRSSPNGGESR